MRLDVKFGEFFQKLKDGDADLNIFRLVESAIIINKSIRFWNCS